MSKTDAVVASIVAFVVLVVLLGIAGLIYLDAQNGKEKNQAQFSQCVENGGTFIKNDRGEPICIK